MRQNDIKFRLQLELEKIIRPSAQKPFMNKNHDLPENHIHFFSVRDSGRIAAFVRALVAESLWPMATAFQDLSIEKLCEKLEGCNFGDYNRSSMGYCDYCCLGLADAVFTAAGNAKKAFDGCA